MNKLTSAILIVGTAGNNADLRYAVPYNGPDPAVCIKQGRRMHLLVGGMEAPRARRVMGGRGHVWTPAELRARGTPLRGISDCCLGLVRHLSIKKVCVACDFPLGPARALERAGIKLRMMPAGLFPGRAIKSTSELASIRQSQKVAARAMDAAVAALRLARVDACGRLCDADGIWTSERLRRLIRRILLEHDCEEHGTIAACGRQAADPHEVGHGPLRAGRGIVLDIFPRHMRHGYWGDLSRTVVKGRPPEKLRRMYLAVRAAQQLALAHIRAGVTARTIYDRVTDFFASAGFPTGMQAGCLQGFIHSVGHGLGLEVHEDPRVGLARNRLRAGQVITVEPGLYYRDTGGVRVEDVVVITPAGCEIIHRARHVFQI